ncbi:MAG: hypothetical protein HYY97_00035 [Rhodocyclales bacterium]|nr:hypothetical protein [Rhodocyclales bacterium]
MNQGKKLALMKQLGNKAVEQTTLSSPLRMAIRRETKGDAQARTGAAR